VNPAPDAARPEPAGAATSGLVPIHAAKHGAAAPTQRTYGIAVGSFVSAQKANAERIRLGEASGLDATVRPVRSGGATVYEVVLGSFRDRASADKAAGDLIDRSVVDEARVVAQNTPVPGH
jgi:cell division protein FtsN